MKIFDTRRHPDWDKDTENFIHLNGDMEVPEILTSILVISYLLEFYNPKKDYRRKNLWYIRQEDDIQNFKNRYSTNSSQGLSESILKKSVCFTPGKSTSWTIIFLR